MTSVVVNSSQQQQALGGQPGTYRPLQYYPAPANMASQQSSNTNVVVANQPARAPVIVNLPTEKPSPATFIVTVILMSLCSFLGMIHLLVCFVPALILSVVGFNYGYSKSSEELRRQARVFTKVAVGLDIAAMVTFALSMVIAAIATPVALTNQFTRYNYYG